MPLGLAGPWFLAAAAGHRERRRARTRLARLRGLGPGRCVQRSVVLGGRARVELTPALGPGPPATRSRLARWRVFDPGPIATADGLPQAVPRCRRPRPGLPPIPGPMSRRAQRLARPPAALPGTFTVRLPHHDKPDLAGTLGLPSEIETDCWRSSWSTTCICPRPATVAVNESPRRARPPPSPPTRCRARHTLAYPAAGAKPDGHPFVLIDSHQKTPPPPPHANEFSTEAAAWSAGRP